MWVLLKALCTREAASESSAETGCFRELVFRFGVI